MEKKRVTANVKNPLLARSLSGRGRGGRQREDAEHWSGSLWWVRMTARRQDTGIGKREGSIGLCDAELLVPKRSDLQMSLCVTTRRGGGRAGRHLLGGEGVFTLPIGLENSHKLFCSRWEDGRGVPLLSRHLTFLAGGRVQRDNLAGTEYRARLAVPAGSQRKCGPG